MYYDKKISAKMRERKRLDFNLEVKSLDSTGRFAGYASVFDIVDNQKDIIQRGAFAETLKGRVHDIKMLWQHQQDEPIGIFERMFEDANGLYVEGRLLLDVARAREAYSLLKERAIGGLSIGYSPTKYRLHEKTGTRLISAVELWEISLVTFPANEAAKITVVKQTIPPAQLLKLSEALDRAIGALRL
ncbi:MAG: HK97 family phage prohead protease [Rickettsiales bacterium]